MQTSQDCGTRHLLQWTPVLPSREVDGSWASKLQSQIALYTTEVEYVAMSQSLHDVIPIMGLLQEMREQNFNVLCTKPCVYCKVFEDNSGTFKMARLPKLCPRTKHINVCYHHFCEHVRKGLIKIFPVNTNDQIADALIKPLAQNDFQCHRHFMCGKWPSQATKVRECYICGTLVLIFTVLTHVQYPKSIMSARTKCVCLITLKVLFQAWKGDVIWHRFDFPYSILDCWFCIYFGIATYVDYSTFSHLNPITNPTPCQMQP